MTGVWRAGLAAVEASRCYTCLPEVGAGRAFNWCVFGCASEQVRLAAGLGGDPAHVEKYVADQIRWLDANGMYRDPDQPAVYDFVTRLQFMTLLHFGYDGPSRAKLEALLDASAEPTLAMLSACGEIPYGGRSNQFLHNNTFYAAVCEWYAARARRRGEFRLAARFAGAARAAVEDLRAWLVLRPMRHVKNLYPRGSGKRGSGMGCEEYAYFDKYMVTMGSWAMMAYVLADDGDDTAAVEPGDAPLAFATTPDFHFVFLRAGDYSAQFDYAADRHYDCDGLGRIHRRGAPAAICLSTPCAQKPKYRTEHPNARSLAIAPVAEGRLEPVDSGHNSDAAWAKWRQGSAEWTCRLGAGGLSSVLTGAGPLALSLPAFSFDGQENTDVSCDGRRLTVRYRGWACVYETDGEIVDTGIVCSILLNSYCHAWICTPSYWLRRAKEEGVRQIRRAIRSGFCRSVS